jgi:hypothetical protein
MAKTGPSQNEGELIAQLMSYRNDPEGFALFAFPWGQKNTPLAQMDGPRQWQRDMFARIGEHLLLDEEKMRIGLPPSPLYIAVSSGRGVGKSAWLSMIDLWVMSCWLGATGIVTANTETQLRSRTMAELGKWHTMSINRHWFDKSTTSLRPQKWFAEVLENKLSIDSQYYYIDAQSWSMENPDAFAGAHSQIGMMLQMDEASGVADSIWSVSEGFFTDLAPLRLWLTISNPRRSSGKFYDCFHKEREYWTVSSVDSRTVEGVDKTVYDRIAAKYGEDHDVTRVEVKGEFPRTGSQQFIDSVTVDEAMTRAVEVDAGAPLVMGVDVARFGEDRSVIAFRQGRDARSIPHQVYHRIDTQELARHVAAAAMKHNPAAIFVDGGGVGGGVVDALKAMRFKIIEVQAGSSPDDKNKYRSKRVEMWDRFKEWLETGVVPNDRDLADDLKGPQYSWHPTTGQLMIESKDEMKKRGIRSPDIAEALLQTFARPVARIDMRAGFRKESRIANDLDYKVFG